MGPPKIQLSRFGVTRLTHVMKHHDHRQFWCTSTRQALIRSISKVWALAWKESQLRMAEQPRVYAYLSLCRIGLKLNIQLRRSVQGVYYVLAYNEIVWELWPTTKIQRQHPNSSFRVGCVVRFAKAEIQSPLPAINPLDTPSFNNSVARVPIDSKNDMNLCSKLLDCGFNVNMKSRLLKKLTLV